MANLRQRLDNLSSKQRSLLLRRLQAVSVSSPRRDIIRQDRTADGFPLSFSQQRLWFLDQLEPGNPTYNVPIAARLDAELDVDALARSLQEVVRRHETLRTTFRLKGDQPVQVIEPAAEVALPVIDLQDVPGRQARVEALIAEHARQPFNLSDGPLLRVLLLRLGRTESLLLLCMHHIVSDGWSVGILIDEWLTLYQSFAQGQPTALPELPIQYADFAVWQREQLGGQEFQGQVEYWKRQLDGAPPVIKLPTDHPRPEVERYRGATLHIRLPADLTGALNALSRQHDATLFMTLLAAFQTLLYRYTKQRDLLVGTPVAGRSRAETEGLIGFFVNTLVIRTNFSGDPAFTELLRHVRTVTLDAFAHQDVPFDKLVEALRPERSLSHAPIYQVMFTFLNEPTRQKLRRGAINWQVVEADRGTANRDLTLRMEEVEGQLVGHFEYNTDLFEATTMQRTAAHFESLLNGIVAQPEARLSSFELVSAGEREAKAAAAQQRAEASRQKFKQSLSTRPKALDTAQQSWVKMQLLKPDATLPLVVSPRVGDFDLATWTKNNRALIETNLFKHGALLFRNFDLRSPAAFEKFALATANDLIDYEERSTPRHQVAGKVYTSTEYPADQFIMLHNEVCYSHRWPLKIWFFCHRPPTQGGATPVGDSRAVYRLLETELREEFERKQVMYVRNYGDEIDLPWQEVFQTTERAQVEAYCRQCGVSFKWKDGNRLQTRQVRQSVARHPRTGEMVWFNSAHMFHVSALGKAVRDSLLALFAEEDLPRHVYFGDGSRIPAEAIAHIRAVYQQTAVSFPWQQGDVLMLDNMLAAHGREPFAGTREIMVAMAEPFSLTA